MKFLKGLSRKKKPVWYRRALCAADPTLGWPEIPDCPMPHFERMIQQRATEHPEKLKMTRQQVEDAGLVEVRMLWFKHFSTFRTSPTIKYIEANLGDHGVAAAYRLMEVMSERYGVNSDFSGVLTLEGATNLNWLGLEIIRPDKEERRDAYDTFVNEEKITHYLQTFHTAGLIVLACLIHEG